MSDLQAIACVPLIASEQAIGAICVGRQDPFNEEDLNLLNAICDMTANAIQRASLYEQTERRLQRLGALRMIDEAITASVDLRLTLNILLEQVANQLSPSTRPRSCCFPRIPRCWRWLPGAASIPGRSETPACALGRATPGEQR